MTIVFLKGSHKTILKTTDFCMVWRVLWMTEEQAREPACQSFLDTSVCLRSIEPTAGVGLGHLFDLWWGICWMTKKLMMTFRKSTNHLGRHFGRVTVDTGTLQGWAGYKPHHLIRISYKAHWRKLHPVGRQNNNSPANIKEHLLYANTALGPLKAK